MRVQHNIMAMGAYRNYTNNVAAMKKNLERLSSGYKINRAGDDAAGLAISEKMRAQITGLETAQKNAKDGISLVQTAEGALTEVHDMLNRMVELATQSANGTYDNDTDRYQLQKEMDQLKNEINRIADSANFNGIKLLDGSMTDSVTSTTVKSAVNLADLAVVSTIGTLPDDFADIGDKTFLHVGSGESKKSSFEVNLRNITVTTSSSPSDIELTLNGSNAGDGIKLDGSKLEGDHTYTAEELAKLFAEAAKDGYTDGNGNKWNVSVVEGDDNSYLLKFELDSVDGVPTTELENTLDWTAAIDLGDAANNEDGQTDKIQLELNALQIGNDASSALLASTRLATALSGNDVKDGAGIMIGDTYYVFALKKSTLDSIQSGGNVKVVDLTDLANDDGSALKVATDFNKAFARLTVAAEDNAMWDVGWNPNDNVLTFYEKKGYGGEGLDTLEGIQKTIQKFDSLQLETTTSGGKGKLSLQIGDTSDDWNQLKVSIEDCHTGAIGIDGISIADQADAQAAVSIIKNAINYVSDVRGTLGATQNRLDHTINNLSVMTENIQDAESTIRDTDIAEEMMAYTKNNILIQSAQAMLAQANQVPQGVLQLLQ